MPGVQDLGGRATRVQRILDQLRERGGSQRQRPCLTLSPRLRALWLWARRDPSASSRARNSVLLADAISNASGPGETLLYVGRLAPGTDATEFACVVDRRVVRCAATEELGPPLAALHGHPVVGRQPGRHRRLRRDPRCSAAATASSPAACLFRSPSSAARNARCSRMRSSAATVEPPDVDGWGPFPGTDATRFCCVVDGRVVGCAATKTWIVGRPVRRRSGHRREPGRNRRQRDRHLPAQ